MQAIAKPVAANHHDLRHDPNRANGARLGLTRTSTDGQAYRTPSAIAAIDQITGLPVHVFRSVVGHAVHRAIRGQTSGRGRSRRIAQAVTPTGTAHHRTAATAIGSRANGTNSASPIGGYRTS